MTRLNVFKLRFFLAVSVIFIVLLSILSFAAESYVINKSETSSVSEHGVCRSVTNNRADYNLFVPTKTVAEWSAFRNAVSALSALNIVVEGCQIVNNMHTFVECTSFGGEVVDDGIGNKICKYNGGACPAGWTQYGNWSTTLAQSATYTDEVVSGVCTTGDCMDMAEVQQCSTAAAICATSGHNWSNQPVESKICAGAQRQREIWSQWRTDLGSCYHHTPPIIITACGAYEPCTGATSKTVTSTITQIGCY